MPVRIGQEVQALPRQPELSAAGIRRVPLQVVAGVLRDARGRVLLTRRKAGKPHAGLWEFPGGKIERDEDALAALARELDEELGIEVQAARPLIAIPHGKIVLDVWEVPQFAGRVRAREGQALAWVEPASIERAGMPPADRPVVTALRLPDTCLVTPAPRAGQDREFLATLDRALDDGVRLVQLRWPGASRGELAEVARAARESCASHGALLLLNADWQLAEILGLDGVHLPARVARVLSQRPLPEHRWVGVSCHDAGELAHAARIGADFATLAPVLPTASHPGSAALGWDAARELVAAAALPVYLLGGLARTDVAPARAMGAQGIAAIRGLWPADQRASSR